MSDFFESEINLNLVCLLRFCRIAAAKIALTNDHITYMKLAYKCPINQKLSKRVSTCKGHKRPRKRGCYLHSLHKLTFENYDRNAHFLSKFCKKKIVFRNSTLNGTYPFLTAEMPSETSLWLNFFIYAYMSGYFLRIMFSV